MIVTAPHLAAQQVGERRPLPRVLYAIAMDGSQKFGSLEEQIYFLAKAFRDEGSLFLPLFLDASCRDGSASSAIFESDGLATASLDLWAFRLSTWLRLNALIRRHRIQLVHWNFYAPLNHYLWSLSAWRPRLQHYFTDHNSRMLPLPQSPRGLNRLVRRALLSRYRQVWCVSQFVQDLLARQQSWSNLNCCLHFINTDRFRPDPVVREQVRKAHGVQGRFVVLVVANCIAEKGVDVALRALARTAPGSGIELSNLQKLSQELGVADRVTFFGQQTQVQPYMQGADCLACPSLWAEAAGLVNLEALSTGLPVLASRIGGIPEYVEDGQTGYLFAPGDYEALATLIGRLHEHPAECRRLGVNARTSAVERFSVGARMNDYLDLYRAASGQAACGLANC
jgi:glycosyltransferase involved in cell wall biosynthesis